MDTLSNLMRDVLRLREERGQVDARIDLLQQQRTQFTEQLNDLTSLLTRALAGEAVEYEPRDPEPDMRRRSAPKGAQLTGKAALMAVIRDNNGKAWRSVDLYAEVCRRRGAPLLRASFDSMLWQETKAGRIVRDGKRLSLAA